MRLAGEMLTGLECIPELISNLVRAGPDGGRGGRGGVPRVSAVIKIAARILLYPPSLPQATPSALVCGHVVSRVPFF